MAFQPNLDAKYRRIFDQAQQNYADSPAVLNLLLPKINDLQALEIKYPQKASVNLCFELLDKISQKKFCDFDASIEKLTKVAEKDVIRDPNLLESFLIIIFLPLLLVLMMLSMIVSILSVYNYVIIQTALLTLTLILAVVTLIPLQPIILIPLLATSVFIGHFLSQFIVNILLKDLSEGLNISTALFFYENTDLKDGIKQIKLTAESIRNKSEGSAVTRSVKSLQGYLYKLFSREKTLEDTVEIPVTASVFSNSESVKRSI